MMFLGIREATHSSLTPKIFIYFLCIPNLEQDSFLDAFIPLYSNSEKCIFLFEKVLDLKYMLILWQEKNCLQFSLQFPLAFIRLAVYPVGGKGMGEIVILARYNVHFLIEHENLV